MRKLIIEERNGIFSVALPDGGVARAITLERALQKAVPSAPEEIVFKATELLEPLMIGKSSENEQIAEGAQSA